MSMKEDKELNEFEDIMKGLNEALAYAEGERDGFRVHVPDTVDVRAVRARTNLTQQRFADVFGIGVATLRQWEQGRRQPRGPARVLLRVIEQEPSVVLRVLAVEPQGAE